MAEPALPPTGSGPVTQGWIELLDRLEADLAETEALLVQPDLLGQEPDAARWHPPDELGPIPAALRPRADAIAARQVAAARAVAVAILANRRQAAVAARIETGGHLHVPLHPSYVDRAM